MYPSAPQLTGLLAFSHLLRRAFGNWWICLLSLVVTTVLFGYFVPQGIEEITRQRTLAPKILDEYLLTWTPAAARQLYAALEPTGRLRYQQFYLQLDFYFPVLALSVFYCSLLSLAFRAPARLAWLNVLPLLMWLMDLAENVNHFVMAGSYPHLSAFSLGWGPVFTGLKYVLILGLLPLAGLGFVFRAKRPLLAAASPPR